MVVFMRVGYIRQITAGYTVVEVVVIIVVISILIGIVVNSSLGYQVRARDSERVSDADVITRSLERYYRTQAVAIGPTYPASSITPTAFATIVNNNDAVVAPGQTTNSVVIAANNNAQTPTKDQYMYQPLQVNGSLCTATPCARYKVYYLLEDTNTVVVRDSLRQQ